ncbi:hypothetical protein JH06_2731 [Blastocystis sp. subtype 4]|uniref:hypothetical protein n=1 Tax=Blastocystis sp. subtype 4 TaxID=944170 RepID=UPI0007115EDA|nr:hypothetical protein JH06_2731 [Blastocystis sp. subtype 4]KNB44401.1 hypothetical protein JH06_2731 [Blastocystis sp. subtype 4]|eukprot:XP_014527844.1 hypothetical protein JH06_2731 [Blastocystis sp. subtype 4]
MRISGINYTQSPWDLAISSVFQKKSLFSALHFMTAFNFKMATAITKTVSKPKNTSSAGSFGKSTVTGIELTPYAVLMTSVIFVAGVVVLHLLHKLF